MTRPAQHYRLQPAPNKSAAARELAAQRKAERDALLDSPLNSDTQLTAKERREIRERVQGGLHPARSIGCYL